MVDLSTLKRVSAVAKVTGQEDNERENSVGKAAANIHIIFELCDDMLTC